eukprot:1158672-Pelagomonas_calceolata.AAC.11
MSCLSHQPVSKQDSLCPGCCALCAGQVCAAQVKAVHHQKRQASPPPQVIHCPPSAPRRSPPEPCCQLSMRDAGHPFPEHARTAVLKRVVV